MGTLLLPNFTITEIVTGINELQNENCNIMKENILNSLRQNGTVDASVVQTVAEISPRNE